jgi:hypothetical protein
MTFEQMYNEAVKILTVIFAVVFIYLITYAWLITRTVKKIRSSDC